MSVQFNTCENRGDASRQAAAFIASRLTEHLKQHERATLVASGGSTPLETLSILADTVLPWSKIDVTLTDERCVPEDHADSNTRMLKTRLLRNRAATASFVPLERFKSLEPKFACCLVGMGEDGHFASLFPDAANLQEGLDLSNTKALLEIHTANSEHRRLSMTLARLVAGEALVLLAFGEAKRRIIDNPVGYPVAALLQQTKTPLTIYWAP